MSSFESLYRGCEDRYHFEAQGTHQEMWQLDIGISNRIPFNGSATEIIKAVAEDCFKHMRGEQRNAQIVIEDVKNVDVDDGPSRKVIHYKLCYQGEVEDHNTDEPLIANVVLNPTTNHRVLLERFSQYDASEMTTFAKFKRAFVDFFAELFAPFETLSLLWEALTGRSEKEMRCDLNLLAEVCGTSTPDSLSMTKSLKYMIRLLSREKEGIDDPDLENRLKKCLGHSRKLKKIRQKFSESSFKDLVKGIRTDIDKLDQEGKEKLLIPVGFHQGGKLVEMFLEIQKTGTDTCTVSLISQSAETLDLFDRKEGVETATRSIRREIANVNLAELQGKIPLFVELQANPELKMVEGADTRDAFLLALHFADSRVSVGRVTESTIKDASFGHVAEMMSYVKEELFDTTSGRENAERFEVAARLRFFLDFCSKDKRWLRNQGTRELVRTTAFRLMDIVESNREELIGKQLDDQSRELLKIVGELEQLMLRFDEVLPLTVNLRSRNLKSSRLGEMSVITTGTTPKLHDASFFPDPYVEVDPPFTAFDRDQPVECINKYAERCRVLMKKGEYQRAGYEAHQMVLAFPPFDDQIWEQVNDPEVLSAFETIGQAIVKGAVEKDQPSFRDAMTASLLNVYGFTVARHIQNNIDSGYIAQAKKTLSDLFNSSPSVGDKTLILRALKYLPLNVGNRFSDYNRIPKEISGPLINLNEYAAITSMPLTWREKKQLSGDRELKFKLDLKSARVKGVGMFFNWSRDVFETDYKLLRRSPDYAAHVAEELGNRYVTELCPYGCSEDNCNSYGDNNSAKARQGHQYYPPYMLYHFIQDYCPDLLSDEVLNPDEIRDLLLIQQTNRAAYDLYSSHHLTNGDRVHKQFEVADGFTEDDRRVHIMNALSIYLRHPNFFKIPELRWFLESKVFQGNCLALLIEDHETFTEHLPFLLSVVGSLQNEIKTAYVNQDMATAGYLVHLLTEFKQSVQALAQEGTEKIALLEAITVEPKETIVQWLIDSAGKAGEKEELKQKELIPYVLHYYLDAYQKNPADPMFDTDRDLELLAVSLAKYEWLCRLDKTIDPKLVEEFQELKTLMTPKILARVVKDQGSSIFINKVINRLNPEVAELNLKWDTSEFPLFTATDPLESRVYQFDLDKGKVYVGGERVDALPPDVVHLPEVRALFADGLDEVWKVEASAPDLSPNAEKKERVIAYVHERYPGQRIVIAMEVNAKGYPTGAKPDVRVERDVNSGRGSPVWATYHRYEAQDKLMKGEPLEGSDLPPKVVAAIGDRTCWVTPKGDRIHVFDSDDNKPYACVVLDVKKRDSDTGLAPIKEFRFTGSERLVSASEKDLEKYAAIEDEGFIMVTGDKGQPCRVEYPRLSLASNGAKLAYTLSNSKGDSVPHFPGYTLAPLGYRPGNRRPIDGVLPLPEIFDNYQALISDGSEMVLIPVRELQQLYSKTGERLPKCKSIPPEGMATSVVFEYEVDSETNRLKAKSGDAYAYLAYVALTHRDYAGAQHYLSKAHQSTGFSKEYLQIFDWMSKWKDESDNGKALKLQAAVFHDKVIEELKQDFIREGKDTRDAEDRPDRLARLKNLTSLYKSYRVIHEQREIGLTGFDPVLDLSPEAEGRVLALCYEYVNLSREKIYEETVSGIDGFMRAVSGKEGFKRAEAAGPDLKIAAPSQYPFYAFNSDAVMLWAHIGNSTNIPSVTYGRPEWVLENFRHAYQLILKLDPTSAEYHELLQKIRFLSVNTETKEKLDSDKQAAIKIAQSYLLRLAAKKEAGSIDDSFPAEVPKVNDPFFGASRKERLSRATDFSNRIDTDQFFNLGTSGLLDLKGTLIKEAVSSWGIKYVDRMIEFSSSYKGNDYPADGLRFLQEVVFGSADLEVIQKIEEAVKALKDQPIVSPQATMEDRAAAELEEGQPVTILEFYRTLFENPPVHLAEVMATIMEGSIDQKRTASFQEAEIRRLEKDTRDFEPTITEKETAPRSSGFHAVLGDQKVQDYRQYYTETSAVASNVDESVFDDLTSSSNPAVKRLAEEHRADMKAYQDDRGTVLMRKVQAKGLRAYLVNQKEELIVKRQQLKSQLIDAVDHFDTPAGILAMRRMTGKAHKPSLDFLINLWRDGKLTLDWEENPLKNLGVNKINARELEELDQTIAAYMETVTTEKHLDRVIHATDIYLDSCGKRGKSTGDQQLAQTLVKLLETKRFYTFFVPGREVTVSDLAIGMRNDTIRQHICTKLRDKFPKLASAVEGAEDTDRMIEIFENNQAVVQDLMGEDEGIINDLLRVGHDPDYRDLLFLEYQMGIIMWKPQVSTYRKMLHNPDLVRQLGMGWGKSKTLLPLLAKRKATGKNLVMLMLPEALYETNCRDLEATNRELFGQGIFRFDFNRQSDRSVVSLQNTYIRLLRTVKEKGYVTTTKNSMLSFRNAYFELLHKLEKIPQEQRETASERIAEINAQLRVMSKILILFAEQTDVIADEVDACLDVRKEVNFALGVDDPVDSAIHDAGIELMDLVLGAKEGTDLFRLKEAILANSNASIPHESRQELMATLAGCFFDVEKPDAVERETFIDYMMNQTEAEEIPEFMQNLQAQRPEHYKKISAAKAFLHQGYGSTLGRVSNVNYGRDPVSGIWTIPYKASNTPSIGSEYDDTIERVSYTIQDYVQNGVSFEQVFNIVAEMRNRALAEIRDAEDYLDLNQTKASQEFAEFMKLVDKDRRFGESPSLAAFETDRKIRQLVRAINDSPMAKLSFVRHYVLTKMTQSPLRVNAVSDDVVAMVAHFGGFSGTLGNRHTFNDRITAEKTIGTDGRTWSLLLQRDVKVQTFSYDSRNSISSLIDGADIVGNYQATIDTGAYLRGITNQNYVSYYLKRAEEKGVKGAAGIYFNKAGKIVKKVGVDGRSIPIDQAAKTDFMSTHTLYDQSHTVGADIKQGRKAKAIVTIGENTFITDLFQAVWRLRQLNEEQEVTMLVSDAVKKMVLGDEPDRDLTIRDILSFCLKNEARKEAEDNFRAEKGKIQGFATQTMLHEFARLIADDETEDGTIHDAALALGYTFTKSRPKDEAFDNYARPRTEALPADLLREAREKAVHRIESMVEALEDVISQVNDHPLKSMHDALEQKREEVKARQDPEASYLPEKVDKASLESGQQVELEAQVEMQLETMAEVDQQQQTETQVQTERIIEAGASVSHGSGGEIKRIKISNIDNPLSNDYYNYGSPPLRQLSETIGAFDGEIFVSAGIERAMQRSINPKDYGAKDGDFDDVANTIFYTYRKAVTDVLIIKQQDGKWKMIVPTIHEAQTTCREFVKKTKDTAVQVFIGASKPLIKFKTGLEDRSNALPFETERDRKQFYRLYVQAKFFNGEINYGSNEEKEALKEWLQRKDPEKCRTLFERHILPAKPQRYEDDYPTSSLAEVFNELIGDELLS